MPNQVTMSRKRHVTLVILSFISVILAGIMLMNNVINPVASRLGNEISAGTSLTDFQLKSLFEDSPQMGMGVLIRKAVHKDEDFRAALRVNVAKSVRTGTLTSLEGRYLLKTLEAESK